MNKEMLEFLFVGPLFSIFKQLNHIRRENRELMEAIMGLKDDLRQLNSDLTAGIDAVAADMDTLEQKLANTPAAEDVSDELASLRANVDRLKSLDIPDPDTSGTIDTGTNGGTSIITPVEPVPDTTTVQSPGEPIGSVADLPEETQPESVPPGQETGPTPEFPESDSDATDSDPNDSDEDSTGEPTNP